MIIKSMGQDLLLNTNMKKEEINDWGSAINYILIRALVNVTKHTISSLDEVLKEDYSYDSLYNRVIESWKYSDKFHKLVKDNPTSFIKRTEYIIVSCYEINV